MVVFVEVLEILSVSLCDDVVLLLRILAFSTIVETVGREAVVVGVFTAIGIFAGQIHVQAQILEAVNLIVYLEVAQQYVGTLVEGVVLNLLDGVRRSVAVAHPGKGGVVSRCRIHPLPVAAPVLELLVVALDRTCGVHSRG